MVEERLSGHRPRQWALVLFIPLLCLANPSWARDYTFVPLMKLIEGYEQYHWGDNTRSINNANQILAATDLGGSGLGYRIDWQGQTPIYTPLESLVGNSNTYEVNGLNSSGHLAGTNISPSCWGCSSAFKWTGGSQIALDSPGKSSRALALNDIGQTVGVTYSGNDSGSTRAALWSNGTLSDLGTLGGEISRANDINNNGLVVGYSHTAPGDWNGRATLWQNGVIQDLGTLGGSSSYANAINDNNQIAGFASREDGTNRPVLWDNGVIVDLMGSSLPTFRGFANDVNIRGAAVGRFGNSLSKAALWQDGTTADLNWFLTAEERSYWQLRNARSINDQGWIVGDAMNMSFEHWAFVLIPSVPEPGMYLMFIVGLAILGGVLRHAGQRNLLSTC